MKTTKNHKRKLVLSNIIIKVSTSKYQILSGDFLGGINQDTSESNGNSKITNQTVSR